MTPYRTSVGTISLTRTVIDINDFKIFAVRAWPSTFDGYLGSVMFSTFASPYMTSSSTSFETFPQSRTIFEIFEFKISSNWPWPLTARKKLWSEMCSRIESLYTTFHLISVVTFSPSRTVFEIFDFKISRVWPWPSTFRGHLRSKMCSPFESSYTASYLTFIDTFSLSRTVFEIFNFKFLWILTLTSDLW